MNQSRTQLGQGRGRHAGPRSRSMGAWAPSKLFSNGEQGAWWDFSDLSNMFQDAAGTIPAVVDMQVGLIRDKSGRGNHITQAGSSRPILRNFGAVWVLEFDGVDDFYTSSSINFTGTDKISVFAGVMKLSDAALGVLVELGPSVATNVGSFNLTAPDNAAANYGFNLNGSSVASRRATSFAAGVATHVLSCNFNIAGTAAADEISPRVNGVTPTLTATAAAGTGNFGNYPLYVGCRGGVGSPFKGYLSGLIIRGALTDLTGVTNTEKYLGVKSGVPL